jgi:hypothetical protein
MAFNSAQITLGAATATPLLVQGTTGTKFNVISLGLQDPLPVQFMITTGTVYWGGPNVSASNGFLMIANVPVVMNVYSNDIPYCYQTAGGAVVSVVVGRQ